MRITDINLKKFEGIASTTFYGYQNLYDEDLFWDSDSFLFYYFDSNNRKVYVKSQYYYFSDTTGERVYGGGENDWHYFLDKTDVHYIDDIEKYILTHPKADTGVSVGEVTFNVTFFSETDPSGDTYNFMNWDYQSLYWYSDSGGYSAQAQITVDVYDNNKWNFKYPKTWKITDLYEFHYESSGGGSGSGSGDDSPKLRTISFAKADDLSGVVSTESAFNGCNMLFSVDLSKSDLENVTNADYMFYECSLFDDNSVILRNGTLFENLVYAYGMFYESCCGEAIAAKLINAIADYNLGTSVEDLYLTFVKNNFKYRITSSSESTIFENDYDYSGSVTVPSSVSVSGTNSSFNVTAFWGSLFYKCINLVSVNIQASVGGISDGCFKGCVNLETYNIPNSVTSIGSGAFECCYKITSVTIPSNVDYLGWLAFDKCDNITSVTILSDLIDEYYYNEAHLKLNTSDYKFLVTGKNSLLLYEINNKSSKTSITLSSITAGNTFNITGINDEAFQDCVNLETVVIPDTVGLLTANSFKGCSSLVSMTLPYGQSSYEVSGSTTYTVDESFGALFGDESFSNTSRVQQYITDEGWKVFYIPNSLRTVVVTNRIGSRAFEDNNYNTTGYKGFKNITSITIPSAQTSIGNRTFFGCTGLTSINIPNSVTSIGQNAFSNCTNLATVSGMTNVTSIGSGAFSYCENLSSVTLPSGLTTLNDGVFINCESLTSINIPDNVISIGYRSFGYCYALSSITIGKAIETLTINNGHLESFDSSNNIRTVTITNTATSIAADAFSGCSGLTSVSIPNTVTSIGARAFKNKGFTSVNIPNSVVTIGEEAFSGCTKLSSTTIPNTVTTIGTNAFYNVKHIFYYGSATGGSWGALYLNGVLENDFLYSDSTKTVLWGYMGDSASVSIPNTVTTISEKAFLSCSFITSLSVPNTVTTIGASAFSGCSGLTSLTIPSAVTSIGNYAFNGCTNLATVSNLNNTSITGIGEGVFKNCSSLTSVSIPSTVTAIGANAFDGCNSITSLSIPNAVTSIGNYAFNNCRSLLSVSLSGTSVTSVPNYAFSGCTDIVTITLSNSVTSFGEYAFSNCNSLTTLSIPSGLTTIGTRAFYGCNSLAAIDLSGTSVTSIGGYAFVCSAALTLPSTLTEITAYMFSQSGVTLNFGSNPSVTTIKSNAFAETSVSVVSLPSSVTTIESNAFKEAYGMSEIHIPSSVTTIGSSAFYDCTVSTAYISTDNITEGAALHISNNGVIYLVTSKNTVSVVKQNYYTDITVADFTAGNSFQVTKCQITYSDTLTSVTFGTSHVSTITFQWCNNLEYMIIPNTVTKLGNLAFQHCSGIAYVYIPNSVTEIDFGAFILVNGNVRIDCQAASKPSGWDNAWYSDASENNVRWNVQTPDPYYS